MKIHECPGLLQGVRGTRIYTFGNGIYRVEMRALAAASAYVNGVGFPMLY